MRYLTGTDTVENGVIVAADGAAAGQGSQQTPGRVTRG
jgi:hypothetical protein